MILNEFNDNEDFIEGTFKSCPNIKGVAQLLTVMGRKNNKVKIHTSLHNLVYI